MTQIDWQPLFPGYADENLYVAGRAFARGRLIAGAAWRDYFRDCRTWNDFTARIAACNGFFAVILKTGHGVMMAADRVRTLPLFYTSDGQWAGTHALALREKTAASQYDPHAVREFFAVGHVTGPRTLIRTIKPVEAGQTVHILDGRIEVRDYFQYLHGQPEQMGEEERHRRMDAMLEEVFNRLLAHANGRTIVLPLSGGYDSRLLAFMMKASGYRDVLCFTYGREDNYDAVQSRRVARHLGLPIHFVNSTQTPHKAIYHSEWLEKLDAHGFNLTAIPNMQDMPALLRLKQEGRIPDNALLISGHSGDFVSGRHLDNLRPASDGLTRREIAENILRLQYSIFPPDKRDKERYASHIDALLPHKDSDASDLYEHWVWRERQAKFLVNSMRVFEVLGHDWHLPLWDNAFMDFFLTLPKNWRKNQRLYREHIHAMHPELDFPPNNITRHGWMNDIRFKRYAYKDWWRALQLMARFRDIHPPNRRFIHKLNLARFYPYARYLKGDGA